jgi:5'-3' exonuclease
LCDVSDRIRSYVKKKLSTDKLWKNLTVVFSDANCPG